VRTAETFGRPGAARKEEIPEPRSARFGFQFFDDLGGHPRVARCAVSRDFIEEAPFVRVNVRIHESEQLPAK
jgi:hypothetical protein